MKFPFSFIKFERRDLRDELVNRFNITRVPCILAFQVYQDEDRFRALILNGGENLVPRLKHLDDQIIIIKKEGGFFNALRIEKKLKEDIENETLRREQDKEAAEKKERRKLNNLQQSRLSKKEQEDEARDKSRAELKRKLDKKELILEFDPVDRLNRPYK